VKEPAIGGIIDMDFAGARARRQERTIGRIVDGHDAVIEIG
jgi:hypothetical protein